MRAGWRLGRAGLVEGPGCFKKQPGAQARGLLDLRNELGNGCPSDTWGGGRGSSRGPFPVCLSTGHPGPFLPKWGALGSKLPWPQPRTALVPGAAPLRAMVRPGSPSGEWLALGDITGL